MKITVSGDGFEQTIEIDRYFLKHFHAQMSANFDNELREIREPTQFAGALVLAGVRALGDRVAPRADTDLAEALHALHGRKEMA